MANIKVSELTNISTMELDEKQTANVVGGYRRYGRYGYWVNDSFNKQIASNYSSITQVNLGYGGNSAYVSQSANNTIR